MLLAGVSSSIIPALAAAAGYRRLVYNATFTDLSGVDTANGGAAGKKLYLRTAWPTASTTGDAWRTGSLYDASKLSIVDGALKANGTNTEIHSLGSGCYNSGFVGTDFDPNGYFEIDWKIDPSLASASMPQWPTFWLQTKGFLLGTANVFDEVDVDERYGTGTGTAIISANLHRWTITAGSVTDHIQLDRSYAATPDNTFHKGAVLIKTAASNGGTGTIKNVRDGVTESAIDYSYSTGGDLAHMDSERLVILVNVGPSQPIFIKSIRVWAA